MVLDEAHALKNRSSARTSKLRTVSDGARFRLLITGTPLQNDLGELQALLEVLDPVALQTQARRSSALPLPHMPTSSRTGPTITIVRTCGRIFLLSFCIITPKNQ